MRKFRVYVLVLLVLALIVLVAFVWSAYTRSMAASYARVEGRTELVSTLFGDVEYLQGGSGADVLVIHGSGGGFDQGELIAEAVLGDQFHWIAPSRYGYLRSSLPEGATLDDQAHAYAALLDHLGIQRAAVIAMSHGGPSAELFAALHPDRVSSLTLISCASVAMESTQQDQANTMGNMLVNIYQRDYRYWLITEYFPEQFMGLLGVSDTVRDQLTEQQAMWVRRVINEMNPASMRAAGVIFDNRVPVPGEKIAAIQAPTLVVHAQDDTLQLYHNAEFAAATIPNASLLSFEQGGHVVMIVEQETVAAAVQQHITANAEQ